MAQLEDFENVTQIYGLLKTVHKDSAHLESLRLGIAFMRLVKEVTELNQKDLAERMQVGVAVVGNVLDGRYSASVEFLFRAAKAAGRQLTITAGDIAVLPSAERMTSKQRALLAAQEFTRRVMKSADLNKIGLAKVTSLTPTRIGEIADAKPNPDRPVRLHDLILIGSAVRGDFSLGLK